MSRRFWSSDKLTGSQTYRHVHGSGTMFWSSDKLTGSQTHHPPSRGRGRFWSSDKLTGSQTKSGISFNLNSFGAVTN